MALTVNQRRSAQPYPNVCGEREQLAGHRAPDISRLSVFTVTRKRSRASRPIGWSASEDAAPVWTFDVGHISSGMRLSRT